MTFNRHDWRSLGGAPLTRLSAALSGALALAGGSAVAQNDTPLTVDQAVQIGLSKNPQVAAGQAGVNSAYASYRSLASLPPLTLSGTHVQGTSTAPSFNGASNDTFIDLGENLDFSGQRRFQAANANAMFMATRFTFQETLLNLEQQIRDAYWSLAAAQAQVGISDLSFHEAQRVYNITVKQEQAGASPRGDVIRSSIDVANAKQAQLTSRGAERTALINLNTLLGRDPSTPEPLSVDLTNANVTPDVQLPSAQDLETRAIQYRPMLKSAAEQARASNYAVRQAEAGRFPDLGINYQRSTVTNVDSVLFTASIPLLDFGSIGQSVKAARETRRQNEALRTQALQQVRQEVAQARSNLELALQSAADYKKEILDPSVTLQSMAQLGYQQGATGILPVIDAEATIRNARVGYLNALLAVYKAQDAILAATAANAASLPVAPMVGSPRPSGVR